MTPIEFNEANCSFGPPPDLAESQCQTIPAFKGKVEGGSMDGCEIVVVAWTPDSTELKRLAQGEPLFISMVGGLAPHFLSTSFHEATHPA